MKVWSVFKITPSESTFCYVVSNPEFAKDEIDAKYPNGLWELHDGFWTRWSPDMGYDGHKSCTHTIVPCHVDHKEEYVEAENGFRWILLGTE